MAYFDELTAAMKMLGRQPKAVFMGQGVNCQGTTMSATLAQVPDEKKLEMPVAENMQMGMALGMSLRGFLPVCIYPRWNFLLLAADQLVNHLDRLPIYSDGGYVPKVIIRTAVPATQPFSPGPQHDDDFTDAFKAMLRTVLVTKLTNERMILPEYCQALSRQGSTLLVEYTEYYKDQRAK